MAHFNPDSSYELLLPVFNKDSKQPTVLTIPNSTDRDILHQLQVLVHIQHQAAQRKPIAAEAIYNGVLQLLAFCLAITFGVFAIISWQAAVAANNFASAANQLATTANDLSRNANRQASDGDLVAAQANCLAAGALALSLIELCGRQTSINGAFTAGCGRIKPYTSRAGDGTGSDANLTENLGTLQDRQSDDEHVWFDQMVSKIWDDVSKCYVGSVTTTGGVSPTPSPTGSASSSIGSTTSVRSSTTSTRSSTAAPTSSNPSQPGSSGSPSSNVGIGLIAAIVTCALVGLGLAAGLAYLRYRIFKEKVARAEQVAACKEPSDVIS